MFVWGEGEGCLVCFEGDAGEKDRWLLPRRRVFGTLGKSRIHASQSITRATNWRRPFYYYSIIRYLSHSLGLALEHLHVPFPPVIGVEMTMS